MSQARRSRRTFLAESAGLAAAGMVPYFFSRTRGAFSDEPTSKNDRPIIGAIGVGGQGRAIAGSATRFGDLAAVCDVDRAHAEQCCAEQAGGKAQIYEDYRRLLDRNDIEAVTVGTPDHWHTPIVLAALRAGKDVYCEKPLTLTVNEGKLLVKAVQETGRILQVGTQQRSDGRFRLACELVRNGRVGKLRKVTVSLPRSTQVGGPFEPQPVPPHLNWDFWLGQAPYAEYCPQRCHFTFRWWYEYSGGIMTDWGAHHMDIAHWGMGCEESGPITIEGKMSDDERRRISAPGNNFNTPADFTVEMIYPGDVLVQVVLGDEGVLFEGEKSRLYVNRGRITGKPVEELAENPLPGDAVRLYVSDDHMGNFFHCIKTREKPISDVVSQHRAVSACHVANISLRLGRKLTWDAAREEFVSDEEANSMLSRSPRLYNFA
jgi:predicted dehydrogenase